MSTIPDAIYKQAWIAKHAGYGTDEQIDAFNALCEYGESVLGEDKMSGIGWGRPTDLEITEGIMKTLGEQT